MDTESKHTPKPWHIEGDYPMARLIENDDKGVVYRITGEGWIGLALVAQITDGTDSDTEESLANARLIAAAPELLEAAELALRAYRGGNETIDSALRAAIEKATVAGRDKGGASGAIHE